MARLADQASQFGKNQLVYGTEISSSRRAFSTDPEEALRRQIERDRAMTGEDRLRLAMELHEFACELAREGIRHQFPHARPEKVEEHLRRRLRLAHHLRQSSGEALSP